MKNKIKETLDIFTKDLCSDLPNAFWDRKKHIVELPYEKDFNEVDIPTKARPIQMNQEYLKICQEEIKGLLNKSLTMD